MSYIVNWKVESHFAFELKWRWFFHIIVHFTLAYCYNLTRVIAILQWVIPQHQNNEILFFISLWVIYLCYTGRNSGALFGCKTHILTWLSFFSCMYSLPGYVKILYLVSIFDYLLFIRLSFGFGFFGTLYFYTALDISYMI